MQQSTLRILCVDDDPDDFILIKGWLESVALVEHAPTAAEALARVQLERFDLLLLDYRLGGDNGIELFRRMHGSGVDTPVVFLTGQGDEDIAVAAMKAGASDYLVKSRLSQITLLRTIRYAIGAHRDAALLQKTRHELVESEERFRALVENISDTIVILDADARILYANAPGALGYDEHENLGRCEFDLVHPDDRERVTALLQQCASQIGSVVHAEFRALHKDGSWREIETTAVNHLSHPAIRGIVLSHHDLTARKRAEDALRLQSSALEAAANSIVITDREGRIVWANSAFARMTGYSLEETIGATTRLLKSGLQDENFYKEMWNTILSCKPWRGELVNRRKDGTTYIEEMTITPVQGANGAITNFIALKQDVTEQRALREQLAQAQKMEAIGRLSGGIAHDFNNVLGVILGYTELLLERIPDDGNLHRQIEEIQKAGRRASSLTRQLLAFSRQQVLQPMVLNINSTIGDMEKMLQRLIGEDVELAVSLAKDIGNVKADRSQIEQILLNLAVNARDAMPQGGKLTIQTSNQRLDENYSLRHPNIAAGDYVVIAVTDTGVGIPAETQLHIFEPFFTTKPSGQGTGLGLATVHGIVRQSGGHIWVYSEPGIGTTFKVFLPRIDAAPVEQAVPEQQHLAVGSEKILLVEDSQPLRELASEMLARSGYEVVEAENPTEALKIASSTEGKIDLLLTDVVMPGSSGRELAEQLVQDRPDLRVVYMSGYTDDAVISHGVLNDGVPFLQKPFTRENLIRKVRDVLDR